jgi:hypothetical protein
LIVAAGGLVATAVWRPTVVEGQAAVARLPGTKNPNINGVWQSITTANWDVLDHAAAAGPAQMTIGAWGVQPGGRGIVEGNVIPYKPEALKKKQANFAGRLKFDPQNTHDFGDPESKCFMTGVPRAMYMPYPFQIVQTADQILMAFEYAAANRMIHMKNHKEAPVPSWMGWSNGKWEGDTLVVEVTAQNGMGWLDRAGNPAGGENLKVTERYTPMGPNHMMYEATLEDPETYTKPFKMSFPLYRRMERYAELSELRCVEFVEDYLYGTLRKKTN